MRPRSYMPLKLATKHRQRSSQELRDSPGRLVSHEDAESLRTMGNQFAMTLSSPPAAWMARV